MELTMKNGFYELTKDECFEMQGGVFPWIAIETFLANRIIYTTQKMMLQLPGSVITPGPQIA